MRYPRVMCGPAVAGQWHNKNKLRELKTCPNCKRKYPPSLWDHAGGGCSSTCNEALSKIGRLP